MGRDDDTSTMKPECKKEIYLALFEHYADREQNASERQYVVTASVVTLNLVIITSLLTLNAKFTIWGKLFGTASIIVFNVVAIGYIYQKAKGYWNCYDERWEIEKEIRAGLKIPKLPDKEKKPEQPLGKWEVFCQFWAAVFFRESNSPIARGGQGSVAFVRVILFTTFLVAASMFLQNSFLNGNNSGTATAVKNGGNICCNCKQ